MNSRVVEEASGAVDGPEKANAEEIEFFFRAYEECLLPAVLVIHTDTMMIVTRSLIFPYYAAKYGFYREPRFLCCPL